MLEFREWLLERQMMMFSTKPVELYHGTYTGHGDEVLRSFKEKGVLPTLATGHGQGQGFYVWSDKNSAINHTKSIKDNPMVATRASLEGSPMVVTIQAIMEPDEWDLDYELNKEKMIEWLHDNHEMANKIMGDQDVRIVNRFSREIPGRGDSMVVSKGIQFREPSGSRSTHYAKSDGGIRAGELVGAIMNKIQQRDPVTVHRFEELFFANMGPGVAVKYVGTKPLMPKSIQIFRDGRWFEAI